MRASFLAITGVRHVVKSSSACVTGALLLFAGMGKSRANLGDTEAQCVARYGNEGDVQDSVGYRQVGDKAVTFLLKKGDTSLNIRVIFLHGKSCHEAISNADSSRGLSESQMEAILDSQGAGQHWHKGNSLFHTDRVDSSGMTSGSEAWQRSDGATGIFWLSSQANSQNVSGQLEVSTKEYTVNQACYDKQNGD